MFSKIKLFPARLSAFAHVPTLTLSLLLLASANDSFAQASNLLDREDQIFTVAEQSPEFVGGKDSLLTYLRKNLQYPPAAKAAGVSGLVYTSFIIRSDGRITDVQVLNGLGHGCDKEAVRVIRAMPNWQPARQSGRPVNFKQNLAISFGPVLRAARPTNTNPDGTNNEIIFTVVEQHPEFTGGIGALQKYLRKNLQYPPAAKAAGVSGRVFTNFVVRSDGRITDVQILKGIGSGCDEEAVRVVSAMPNWQPGKQSGQPVNVKYNLPISFGL